ncbi:MAG: molecular chaperone HtpG [Selenomonadaceae bacterium]|nr:molecular chaperone HtpG [Selenomonadaceae bacterium]
MATEKLEFQAETKRLLDLVVNSIYTNKEIFLRELVSNASDALDKLRIESLTNKNLLEGDESFEIFVVPDENTKTITISDNGIGMTRDEVINNIGTIAKSGTKDFLDKIRESSNAAAQELIGQFGVGFYSAFIVADKVELITRKAGTDSAVKWTSDGAGEYELEDFQKDSRGTTIILHLKKEFGGDNVNDEYNFTDIYEIERLIKKYSDFVRYPIKMSFEIKNKPEDEPTIEVRTVNSMKPLWTRSKSEITREEYDEFFKQQLHEWEPPLEIFHVKAEGTFEYTALVCIPKKAAPNLYYSDYEAGLQLYSRHVFIMDKCKDFLPDWLRFMKGLVDSPDLPLNISRELLQQSTEVKVIGKALEKNILKQLAKLLKDDRDKYEEFWAQFGKSLKIGVYNSVFDSKAKDSLKDLLLFQTSRDGKFATLAEYVERMPDFQQNIYFAVGKNSAAIEQLPQMELLRERGLEVLYLTDPVDEFTIDVLHEYAEKHFQSITRENFHLDDAESQKVKAEVEEIAKTREDLLKDVKEAIGGDVKEVRLTSQLKTGAVCLVTGEGGPSLSMEKTFAAMNNPMFKATQILELNPNHAVFKKLESLHALGKDNQAFKDLCTTLYSLALLIEGVMPDNPADLANKVTDLLTR